MDGYLYLILKGIWFILPAMTSLLRGNQYFPVSDAHTGEESYLFENPQPESCRACFDLDFPVGDALRLVIRPEDREGVKELRFWIPYSRFKETMVLKREIRKLFQRIEKNFFRVWREAGKTSIAKWESTWEDARFCMLYPYPHYSSSKHTREVFQKLIKPFSWQKIVYSMWMWSNVWRLIVMKNFHIYSPLYVI